VVGTCQLACGSSVDSPSVVSVVLVLEKASQTPPTNSPAAGTLESGLVTPVLRSKNMVILPLSVDFIGEVVDLVTFLLGFNSYEFSFTLGFVDSKGDPPFCGAFV
jgi:hypothetical protein